MKTILHKIKKRMLKSIHHLRQQRLFNKITNSRKRSQAKPKKIGKMPILIHQLTNLKEMMAPQKQPRKTMKRTMKTFSDNKSKTRKISVTKSKVKKLMVVNRKLVVIRKQMMMEKISSLLKPLIKKRQRELRKERRHYWQDKSRERQNCRRRRESFR